MSNETLQLITPVLNTILVAILGLIGKEIVKVVPKVIELIIAKIGLTNYTKIKAIAWDIWNATEEYFRLHPEIKTELMSKGTYFAQQIRNKIPGITDDEIESLKQAIAGEFNKDKPAIVQAVDQPIEAIPAVVKYFAPDGITELQPITTTPTV